MPSTDFTVKLFVCVKLILLGHVSESAQRWTFRKFGLVGAKVDEKLTGRAFCLPKWF